MSRFLIFICTVLFLFLHCGCSDENPNAVPQRTGKRVYPKITGHHLRLKVLSTRGEYYRDEGAPTLRFILKNEGTGIVSIREWKANDYENIRLSYAICPKRGSSASIPERAWRRTQGGPEKRTVRYPIDLGPQNAVMVDVPMNFFQELKPPCLIAVRGETDLQSLDLKSLPIEINVR